MEEMNNQEEYELVRERIKTRPINRKKLFRRTVITAAMAVIFGVLACITFLVLEPVFSNMLTPEEEPVPDEIRIPLDEEETSPEDFILEDEEEPRTQIIYQETERTTTSIEDYQNLYNELYDLAKTCQKSLVTVTGVSQDVDWFNNSYESEDVTTGLIVANNGIELLILTDGSILKDSENIEVTFFNELVAPGTIKESDKNTGLAIVGVPVDNLTATLLDPDIIAKLGNSKTNRLMFAPVIALGRPIGNTVSYETGMITYKANSYNLIDNNYDMFVTDMNGSASSNGVIFNLSGEVLGIIYQKNKTGVGNVVIPKKWANGTPAAPRKLKFRAVKTSVGAYMTIVKDNGEFKRVILSIPMNKNNSIWGMVDSRKNMDGADKDTLEDLEF